MEQSTVRISTGDEKEPIPLSFKIAVLWRQIKMLSRELKFRWQTLSPPQQTPHGFVFWGNKHVIKGTFEPHESRLFNALLPFVDEIVNVGANVGYYCCHALRKKKHVIAFEPDPLNIRYLLSNLQANGWSENFELFPFCLGEKREVKSIFGHGTGASLLKGWADVPETHSNLTFVNTADNIFEKRGPQRRLFMVDIEGAEYSFLKGAKSLINSDDKHYWILEINIANHFPDSEINPKLLDVIDIFLNAKYDIWGIKENLVPISREIITSTIAEQKDKIKTHNFLFLPSGNSEEILDRIKA